MTLQDLIQTLNLRVLTRPKNFSLLTPQLGYASDLLSYVMANAKHGSLWVTLQAHANIVAIGALLELTAIIISENGQPDAETIAKANAEGVTLLSSSQSTFAIAGRLWELGLRNE